MTTLQMKMNTPAPVIKTVELVKTNTFQSKLPDEKTTKPISPPTKTKPSATEKQPRVTKKSQLEASALQLPSPDNYRCQECGLCKSEDRKFHTPREIKSTKRRLLIVTSALHDWDNNAKGAFNGPAELLFKNRVLKPLGFSPEEVSFGYAARCYAPSGKPSGVQLSLCGSFLWQDIARLKPTLILCLGLEAAKAVLQQRSIKLKDYIGRQLQVADTKVLVTYSPRMVLAKKNMGYLISAKTVLKFWLEAHEPLPFPAMKEV